MSAQSVSSGAKHCCNGGKTVAGQKRMKDSQGRYWCVPCGQADQRKKGGGGGGGSSSQTTCAGCGGTFPARKLQEYARQSYCKRCFNKLTGGGGGFSLAGLFGGGGGGGSEEHSASKRKKIIIAVAAVVVLGLASVVLNFGLPGADDGDEPAIPEYADPNYGKKQ